MNKHGHATRGRKSPEYRVWANILRRCNNPKHPQFKNYGGRGIKVWPSWYTFENFYADVGNRPEGMTFDRTNNDGSYWPGNWRWTTSKEQNNNQRPKSCGPNQPHTFMAMDDQGATVFSDNQCEFARQHNLEQANISNCLTERRKIHKGWTFQWL